MTTINVGLLKSNVEELVNQRGESKTKVFINSGVGKDFFSNLNKGQIPSVEKIMSLADYLEVSTDYLLGRTEDRNGYSNKIVNNGKTTVKDNGIQANVVNNQMQQAQFDSTTLQVAEIFQNLDVFGKAQVLALMVELSEKKGT